MSVPAGMQSVEGEGLSGEARQSPGDREGGCHGEDWKLDLLRASPSPRSVCQVRMLLGRDARGKEDGISRRRGLGHPPGRLTARPGPPALRLPRLPAGLSDGSAWLRGGGVGGERRGPSRHPLRPAAAERLSPPRPGRYRLGKLSNATGLFREVAFPLPRCAPVQSRHRGSSNPPRAAAGQDVSSGKAKAPPSLRPCSKCSPGSGEASPGLCTPGARSPR